MNWNEVINHQYTEHQIPSFSFDRIQTKKGIQLSPQVLLDTYDPATLIRERKQQRQQNITAEELIDGKQVVTERIIEKQAGVRTDLSDIITKVDLYQDIADKVGQERSTSKFYGLSFWLLVCGLGLSAYVLALGGFDFTSLTGMFVEGWSKLISFLS